MYILLLFCTALACATPLPRTQAFEAVFGESEPAKLKLMAENFQEHCKARKTHLFEGDILQRHPEFLDTFTQQTKARCEALIKQQGSGGDDWFEDLDTFESVITSVFPQEHPQHKITKAKSYAKLCDFILFYATEKKQGAGCVDLNTRQMFLRNLKRINQKDNEQESDQVIDACMMWMLTKDGLFSMRDYLIVLSENLHLGSASTHADTRDSLYAHGGLIKYHQGALDHDIAHAESALLLFTILKQHGCSAGDYVKECFCTQNPQNVIELGQKILAIFTNLHEFAPTSLDVSLEKTLFPDIKVIPDPGLYALIPFFMDATIDISEAPFASKEYTQDEMLEALLSWRKKYLGDTTGQYIKKVKAAKNSPEDQENS